MLYSKNIIFKLNPLLIIYAMSGILYMCVCNLYIICGKHLSNVVALYLKMSQSVLRLFVNNAINFMILFLPLLFPTSRNLNNLNKQSCKKK